MFSFAQWPEFFFSFFLWPMAETFSKPVSWVSVYYTNYTGILVFNVKSHTNLHVRDCNILFGSYNLGEKACSNIPRLPRASIYCLESLEIYTIYNTSSTQLQCSITAGYKILLIIWVNYWCKNNMQILVLE